MAKQVAYRKSSLYWPPTPDQWAAINDEFENLYRVLKTGNFGATAIDSTVIAPSGATTGTYGSASRSITETVGVDGRVTSVSDAPIAIDGSAITTGTLAAARLPNSGVTAGTYGDATHVPIITVDATGRATALSTVALSSVSVFNETPGGSINGSNTSFTTALSYTSATLRVYLNGVRLASSDFTETGATTFTTGTAPATGDLLRIDYGTTAGAFVAGNGILNTSGTISVKLDGTTITESAAGIKVTNPSARVLLEEHTASSSASLDFTTRNGPGVSGATFQSDFDEYVIEFVGLVPATNSVGIGLRVTTNGGTTWDSTGSYAWTHWVYGPAGTGQTSNTAQTEIRTIGFVNVSNTNTFSVNGAVRTFSPLSTALHKAFCGQIAFWDTGPGLVVDIFSGAYSSTSAINGVRVLATSGNLASGTVRIYGVSQ